MCSHKYHSRTPYLLPFGDDCSAHTIEPPSSDAVLVDQLLQQERHCALLFRGKLKDDIAIGEGKDMTADKRRPPSRVTTRCIEYKTLSSQGEGQQGMKAATTVMN